MVMLGAPLPARICHRGAGNPLRPAAGRHPDRHPDRLLPGTAQRRQALSRQPGNTWEVIALREVAFHLAIYHNNPGLRAVVHLHCTHLTALSPSGGAGSGGNVIRPFTPYYVMRVGQPAAHPLLQTGDARIAEELGRRAPEGNGPSCLLNHGPAW